MLKEELFVTTLLVRSYAYAGKNSIFGKMRSFKLFFSSSFSVWEKDWGHIVRQKKRFLH